MDGISPTVQAMLDRTARDWGLQQNMTPSVTVVGSVIPRHGCAALTQEPTASTARAVALACD